MGEPDLRLPLTVVRVRGCSPPERVRHEIHPEHAVAFSDAERAAAFVAAYGGPAWDFCFVTGSRLPELITELKEQGLRGLHLDPAPDGGGGRVVDLKRLVQLAHHAGKVGPEETDGRDGQGQAAAR